MLIVPDTQGCWRPWQGTQWEVNSEDSVTQHIDKVTRTLSNEGNSYH